MVISRVDLDQNVYDAPYRSEQARGYFLDSARLKPVLCHFIKRCGSEPSLSYPLIKASHAMPEGA